MLKNLSKLELVIENKAYAFLVEMDAPLAHVKEALFQFQGYVAQVEANMKAQQDAKAQADAQAQASANPEPDIKPEVVA